jgi:hypothetical protein
MAGQHQTTSQSFWLTLPGVLTGFAGFLAAVATVVVALKNLNLWPKPDSCRNVEVVIRQPKEGDQASSLADVTGTTTVDEECRYVFIVVAPMRPPTKFWRITDLTQVQKDGSWAGNALLDEIPLASEATIEVRVTSEPDIYRIDQHLPNPPTKGRPSDLVRIRRVQ